MQESNQISKVENKIFTNELKKFILNNGASIVGIADLTVLNDYKHEPEVPRGFSRAISIGIGLTDEIINKITKGPTKAYAELYRTTNEMLLLSSHFTVLPRKIFLTPSLLIESSDTFLFAIMSTSAKEVVLARQSITNIKKITTKVFFIF